MLRGMGRAIRLAGSQIVRDSGANKIRQAADPADSASVCTSLIVLAPSVMATATRAAPDPVMTRPALPQPNRSPQKRRGQPDPVRQPGQQLPDVRHHPASVHSDSRRALLVVPCTRGVPSLLRAHVP